MVSQPDVIVIIIYQSPSPSAFHVCGLMSLCMYVHLSHHILLLHNRERILAGGKSGVLTARLMEKRLGEWANGGDSLMWGDFQTVLSTQPEPALADA